MPTIKRVRKKNEWITKAKHNALDLWGFTINLLIDPSNTWKLALPILFAEVILNIFIIHFVKYTEIDWVAYMQEVEGVINGTYDYMELKGNTGPLVYPAGFVYVYSIFYYLTSNGTNVRLAQYLFGVLYIINLLLVVRIYSKSQSCPPYVFIFMSFTSYRIHSLFVLRLFNDPVAILLFHVAGNFFISKKWLIGCLFYSLAVSVKMNILLFAPALLIILLNENGLMQTGVNLAVCALTQIVLALPFLAVNPIGYIIRSFDFGRQFFYIWTVNWKILPEQIFLNRYFQISLLLCHLFILTAFLVYNWCGNFKNVFSLLDPRKNWRANFKPFSSFSVIYMLFVSNFVGMCFSRSLHYQFYVWYYYSLPFLLWQVKLHSFARLLILGMIELSWNTYPATFLSSFSLHIMHLLIIVSLWFLPTSIPVAVSRKKDE